MAVILLVVIRLLSSAAIDSEIKRNLQKDIRINQKNVSVENQKLEISEDFFDPEDKTIYLILKRNGKVIEGEYPKEAEAELSEFRINTNMSRCIVLHGEKYYFRDRRIGKY